MILQLRRCSSSTLFIRRHIHNSPIRSVHHVPDFPPEPVGWRKLLHYRRKYAGRFPGDSYDQSLGGRGPCPYVTTLKLDEGIRSNQWFRISGRSHLVRKVLHDGKLLGPADVTLPALGDSGNGSSFWVCPYFDTASQTMRMWRHGSGDLGIEFSLGRLSRSGMRSLLDLAFKEGLIASVPGVSIRPNSPRRTVRWKHGYKPAVDEGYSGSFEEWAEKCGKEWGNPPTHIQTLVREKTLANGQQLTFRRITGNLRSKRIPKFVFERRPLVNGIRTARVIKFSLPITAFPDKTIMGKVFMYFNPEKRCLCFCYPDGNDVPGSEIPETRLRGSRQSLLALAQAEGLLDKIPASRLQTLNFVDGITSGFYCLVQRQPSGGDTSRVAVRLDDGATEHGLRVRLPPNTDTAKAMPYVDKEQLRIWDKGRECDLELRRGIYALDAHTIRRLYPNMYAFAQSLGHWSNL